MDDSDRRALADLIVQQVEPIAVRLESTLERVALQMEHGDHTLDTKIKFLTERMTSLTVDVARDQGALNAEIEKVAADQQRSFDAMRTAVRDEIRSAMADAERPGNHASKLATDNDVRIRQLEDLVTSWRGSMRALTALASLGGLGGLAAIVSVFTGGVP